MDNFSSLVLRPVRPCLVDSYQTHMNSYGLQLFIVLKKTYLQFV